MARVLLVAVIALFNMTTFACAGGLDDAKRGLAELVRGDFDLAIAYTTQAIESGELERESLAISYYNRASGYLRQDRRDRAIEDFRRAYEAWPEHPLTQEKMREFGLLSPPIGGPTR